MITATWETCAMCNYFPTIKLKVTPGKSPVVKDNSTCDHCVHPGQAPGGHPGLVILQRISDQGEEMTVEPMSPAMTHPGHIPPFSPPSAHTGRTQDLVTT